MQAVAFDLRFSLQGEGQSAQNPPPHLLPHLLWFAVSASLRRFEKAEPLFHPVSVMVVVGKHFTCLLIVV